MFVVDKEPNVGASLLAKAVGQSQGCWIGCRHREQARSHKGIELHTMFVVDKEPNVGASLLAKAVGQ